MGQPALAFSAALSKAAWSAPGMRAVTSKWTLVTVQPASNLSRVTEAVVSKLSGVMPAFPSCAESAMVKHPACAAAINSSGLVPLAFSKRVENEYGVLESTPLSLDIVPFPSLSDPFHTADALRTMNPSSFSLDLFGAAVPLSEVIAALAASPLQNPFYSISLQTPTRFHAQLVCLYFGSAAGSRILVR